MLAVGTPPTAPARPTVKLPGARMGSYVSGCGWFFPYLTEGLTLLNPSVWLFAQRFIGARYNCS